MALYRYVIIFAVVCSLVSFSMEYVVITLDLFEQYQCSSICTEKKYRDHLKAICDQINPLEVPAKSGECQKEIHVAMKNGNFDTWFSKEVGMCTLSNGVKKCVTMGFKANQVLIFPYAGTKCDEPYVENFEFPGESREAAIERIERLRNPDVEKRSKKKGGFLDAIASFFRCCFGG